eukprot:TRINITY_DN10779_c0_g1_i2.p1 TRINITY_DN10779_c0_g1~~TRINITY_DN10779_c0_g1_i2.p1  ORF type:complete len:148 (+),score=17.12 TRINITY_DN10779_c0_g1_i2:101-544(+)
MTEFDEYTSNFDRLRLEFERELTYFETKNEQGKKKHLEKLLSPDHPLIKQSQDWIECYETALQDLPISERMKFQHALFDFKKFLEDLRNQSKSRLDKLTRETLQGFFFFFSELLFVYQLFIFTCVMAALTFFYFISYFPTMGPNLTD